MEDIDKIRIQIRTLDDAETHGLNVTQERTYWCQKAVEWAIKQLTIIKEKCIET